VYNDQRCVDYSTTNEKNHAEMWNCHGLGGNQVWKHDKATVSPHITSAYNTTDTSKQTLMK